MSFTERDWGFVSHQNANNLDHVDLSEYSLVFPKVKSWLIDFPICNGKNLLIPCIEFFIRCYGYSVELKRVLATYPDEEVFTRLFRPFEQPAPPNTWAVNLARRMANRDVVFLAHYLKDDYTQRAAKSIYSQISVSFLNNEPYAFPQIKPWFQGAATIKTKGVWINNGKTFLALNIVGCSDPKGCDIARDRANTNKVDEVAEGDDIDPAWDGVPPRELMHLPDIIDLTVDVEPDHGAPTIDVQEDPFEIIGEPRKVVDVKRDKAKTKSEAQLKGDSTSKFSPGDPYGAKKGVGFSSIHAQPVFETQGILWDMWNALRRFSKDSPGIIQSVEWYTKKYGFVPEITPELIPLVPFELESNVEANIKKWVYFDVTKEIPRGVLIVKIKTPRKIIYILEIQRRRNNKKVEEGAGKKTEESFKGLVFAVNDLDEFDKYLKFLLDKIRLAKGIVHHLTGNCPGEAHAFVHSTSGREKFSCEAAVRNAFNKFDISI